MNGEAHLELDSPHRFFDIQKIIKSKPSLMKLYEEYYQRFSEVLKTCPPSGIALELGSGAGFIKEVLPDVTTSDVIPYEGVDSVVDATKMPFGDGELRAIFLLLVFHHIPNVPSFLREATRCLKEGGRIYIVDQHHGWLSRWILKYAHHEPYHADAREWEFESSGPLSDANGALSWIVFSRDVARFKREFPDLELLYYRPITPLRYWLTGGLKSWSLLPNALFPLLTWVDRIICRFVPNLGSFVEIEIRKRGP